MEPYCPRQTGRNNRLASTVPEVFAGKADAVGMAKPAPHRDRWLLFSLLLLCLGISPAIPGDPAEYTNRTDATEVRLNFSATDQNHQGVTTLQASDFAVVDQNVIVRKFLSFSRSTWTSLEVAILVDTSESVGPRFRQEIAQITDLISQRAAIPEESLSIFTFHVLKPRSFALEIAEPPAPSKDLRQNAPVASLRCSTPSFSRLILSRTGAISKPKKLLSSSLMVPTPSAGTPLPTPSKLRCAMMFRSTASNWTSILLRPTPRFFGLSPTRPGGNISRGPEAPCERWI